MGVYMCITMAVLAEYGLTAYENLQKKQEADIILEARLHEFSSTEFVTSPTKGTVRTCRAITTGKVRPVIRELDGRGNYVDVSSFCSTMMSHENLNNWKDKSRFVGPSIIEMLLWSIGFFIVFMVAAFLVMSIPANLIALLFPSLIPVARIIALGMTLPVLIFWAVMTEAALTPVPTHWHDANGYLVTSNRVFVSRDYKMYTAPEQLFDWANSGTISELTTKF